MTDPDPIFYDRSTPLASPIVISCGAYHMDSVWVCI